MARSLRKQPRVSYAEVEEPAPDEFVFCASCGDYVFEYCSIHGPLLVVPDDKMYDREGKRSHVIDAADPKTSNWMRYVNCSRHWCEQNLVAYQYKGEIYYRTIKIIPRFTELLVYYGAEFAHMLRVDIRGYNSPPGYAQKFGAPPKKTSKKTHTEESAPKKAKHTQPTITNTENIDANNNLHTDTQQVHVNVSENLLQNDLLCDICNYKTQSKQSLELHLILHTQEKNVFKCDYCGYMSKNKYHLIKHLRTHTGEKPFSCEFCNHKFTQRTSLRNHMRTHTGEKPFSCKVCNNYKCSQSSYLKRHMKIHTGEKPFSCEICNYKCTESGRLKKHMRIHTGEKPFSCQVCNYKCAQSGNLKDHMRTHTGEKPYSCKLCNYKFTQSGSLKKHMKTQHSNEK